MINKELLMLKFKKELLKIYLSGRNEKLIQNLSNKYNYLINICGNKINITQ